MAGGTPVSRTVAIYIDQAAAEQSAEKLRKKIESLEKAIKRGEQAGRDMSSQIVQLGNTRNRLTELDGVISGRMTPSIRQMSAHVTQLRNELVNMSRDAPGYAARFDAFRNASNRLNELNRELRGVEATMERTNKPGFWSRLKDGVTQGLGIAGGLNIAGLFSKGVSWIKQFAVGAADAAAKMESLRVAYSTLLGSRVNANEMIRDLQKFAQATPFEFNEVSQLTKQLLAYGFAQKEIIPTLERLGNVASGVGKEKLPQLMLAFGQVRSAGRLMGQELLQFVNAGFSPLQVISEKTGKSMRQLKKDMENGLISFDMVQDAFKTATSEGGRFFNLMGNQSRTTSGALAALSDNWEQFKTSLGGAANGILRDAYVGLGKIVTELRSWVSLNPAQELQAEKDELNGMVYALMNVNNNQALRSQLIQELKTKYPQFLSFIDAETASSEQLGKALAVVNQQYDHKIRLAALEQRQEVNTDKQKDLEGAYLDAQIKLAERLKVDVVAMARMTKEERQALIQQRVKEELAKSKDRDWLDKMLAGAGGSEGARGVKITDETLLRQYASLEADMAKKQKKLDDDRLQTMGLISAENERQIKQDEESLRLAKERVKEVENNEKAIVAFYTGFYKNGKMAAQAYQKELEQAKKMVTGIEQSMAPAIDPVKPKEIEEEDSKTKKAREKAAREHAKAEKDVYDLQFKLNQLKEDLKAATLDADAGFEDKANAEIQKVLKKYEAYIKEAKDRLMKVAGLTETEKDALNQIITEYGKLQQQELDNLQGKQFIDRSGKEYKSELQSLSNYFQQQKQLVNQAYSNGEISKQQYKDRLLALEKQEADAKVLIAEDYSANVKEAASDIEKAKTSALEKGIKDRDAIEDRAKQKREAELQRNLAISKKGSRDEWQAKRQILINGFKEQKDLMLDNSIERQALDAQEKEQLKALDKQYWETKVQNILQIIDGVGQLFSSFMNYLNQGDENRLKKEQADNDKKKKGYQKMLDNKQISQEQYNQYIEEADAEMEKKSKEAQKKKAKRDKAAALFQAIISTAAGVAGALQTQPVWLGIAMAAIVGAMGGLQIASIASADEPQFAKGGVFDTAGGIAQGPSHAEGGIGMYNEKTGKKVGEMEGNEAYMILSKKTTAANLDIINQLLASSMNGSGERIALASDFFQKPKQIDYGNAIESISYVRHYRNGGVTQPVEVATSEKAPAGISSSDQQVLRDLAATIEKLDRKLDRPFNAQVAWTDIKRKQDQYEMLQKVASFQPER